MDEKPTAPGWVGRVRVSGAMNPALLFAALTLPIYGAVLLVGRDPPAALTTFSACSVGLVLYAYVYFSVTDPDRLQSEDFQLKKQSLAMVRERGTKQQAADAAAVVLSAKDHLDDGGE